MLTNYHTHTFRCNHAEGSDEQYVINAIKAGVEVLGFSDHCPWPLNGDERGSTRMKVHMLDDYIESILDLKEKYKSHINVKLGLECEYFTDRIDWLINIKKEKNIEFLILGNHFHNDLTRGNYYGDYKNCNIFTDYLKDIKAALDSTQYIYIAHPDLFMKTVKEWNEDAEILSEEICRLSNEHDTPLEYNLGGIRAKRVQNEYYPYERFWEIAARKNCKAVIGIDAHKPEEILEEYEIKKASDYLNSLGVSIIRELNI